jgi:glycosyltransferase involved in cell wall biosynthesis
VIVHFFEPPLSQTTGGLSLAITSLRSFLQRTGVDVRTNSTTDELLRMGGPVHFHGLWQPRFARVSRFCRREKIHYAVSPHGMLEPWAFKHRWWKKFLYFYLLEKAHLAAADYLVATSELEARNLKKLFPTANCKALSLPLADASKWPNYSEARATLGWKEFVLLFLSRIHPKKGLHLLLGALTKIDPERELRLVIIGGGKASYLRKLQRFQQEHHSDLPPIDWVGEVWSEKKWLYLQGADLFCLPSYSENFGLAVLEALQVGTRVLTTNQTPWTDLASWKAGYAVEPNEASVRTALMEEFSRSEAWSSEQRDFLAKMIHHRFAPESVFSGYLELYRTFNNP